MAQVYVGKLPSGSVKIEYNQDASSSGFVPLQPNPAVPPPVIPIEGAGDMFKAVYDKDNDGVVDKAEQVTVAQIPGLQATLNEIFNQLGSGGGGGGGSSAILFATNTGGESFLAGTPVTKVGEEYLPARTLEPRAKVLGVALEPAAPGAQLKILQSGLLSLPALTWDALTSTVGGLVPNATYYITTDSKISTTAPTESPHYLVKVGTALNNTDLLVDLDLSIKL